MYRRSGSKTGPTSASNDTDNDKYTKIKKQHSQVRAFLYSAVLIVSVGVAFRFVNNIGKQSLSSGRSSPAVRAQPNVEFAHSKPVNEATSAKKVEEIDAQVPPVDDATLAKEVEELDAQVPPVDEATLAKEVEELDAQVRSIKREVDIFETDKEALAASKKLQDATRKLLAARYGPKEPYRVRVDLEFQKTISDFDQRGAQGSILLEMAPSSLVPHSIFSFMEIARGYKGGAFHRVAGHVLQVMVKGGFKNLAFQEYSEKYPHKKGTVGYAGRPSGPAWYVSIQDNSRNHGPGSQQQHNPHEADSCFGRVIGGFDVETPRISLIGNGFINDPKKHVIIKELKILVPGDGPGAVDGYVEWSAEPKADLAV